MVVKPKGGKVMGAKIFGLMAPGQRRTNGGQNAGCGEDSKFYLILIFSPDPNTPFREKVDVVISK